MKFMLKLVLFFVSVLSIDCGRLEEKFIWKELDYAWPSPEAKDEAVKAGSYIEPNNLPLGLEVWKNRLFITVPRWKKGVASSLNYVEISDEVSPVLHPYPTWEDNTLPADKSAATDGEYGGGRQDAPKAEKEENLLEQNNATIISTFRVRADECDRLWVLDTGLVDILGSPKQLAPNSIAIFDLNTDQLIRRFVIPEGFVKEDSFFANIIVDVTPDRCDEAFAYIPDLGAYQVIVYDLKEDKSWKVKHNFFHFDPLQGDYNVAGVNFQWTDGVFGMALSKPINDHGDRTVYFHALSSTKEFSVSNTVFKNETYATDSSSYYAYKLVGERGPRSQSTAEFLDPQTDVIFYTQVNKDAIGCWNTKKDFNPSNQGLVDSDSNSLVFPNDLKVDRDGNLWVLSDRMPLFIYASLKTGENNYRVLKGKTTELIKGTPCQIE